MGKRDDIINATMRIIAEEGILNATIGNILKSASTGYGTLYNYFSTKEDLYLTVYINIVKGIDDYLKASFIEGIDSKQALKLILHRYIDYCLEKQIAFNTLEALRYVPEICNLAKKNLDEEVFFLKFINSCEDEGVIKRRDPQYNLSIILGMVSTFIKYYYQYQTEVSEDKKQDFINSCLNALA